MLTAIWDAVFMICVRESLVVVIQTARHDNVTRSTVKCCEFFNSPTYEVDDDHDRPCVDQ